MPNVSNDLFTDDQRRFVDDMASLLAPWGLPQLGTRLYAYLLICDGPVTLDKIAADLQVSKSSACTAAKQLERANQARRHSERGSNRVLYSIADDRTGPLAEQSQFLASLAKLLHSRGPSVAQGKAATRLNYLAKFYLKMRDAIEGVIAEAREQEEADLRPARRRAGR